MEITTKGRYAVRVMVDIAKNDDEYVSISDIASRQKISQKYLEKIIAMLVKGNLVESKRGVDGGYKLSKKVEDYNVKEILDACGESTKVASCEGEERCPMAESCDTMGVWHTLNHLISDYLEKITLKDLIDKTYQRKKCE
ncbi:MAG: Rrf2 family transcriptional regulator [Clostridia bacterium]|nr:Rrf2 family transcriptional regulator [Clostridia bacterium]MBQ8792232.1 Rrf2 family transcriptional regulator [Clostridia bacterium]